MPTDPKSDNTVLLKLTPRTPTEVLYQQTVDSLREQLAETRERLARAGKICSVCFTSSWEPTPDGERCGYCWLQEELLSTLEIVIDSAYPTCRDHPTMFSAWKLGNTMIVKYRATLSALERLK